MDLNQKNSVFAIVSNGVLFPKDKGFEVDSKRFPMSFLLLMGIPEVLPFVGFAAAMFLFYSLVPVLLKIRGSAMLNLSLLTSDMWAVVIRIFAYHQKVDWLYFVAFASVAVGLLIYSWGQKDEDQTLGEDAVEHIERSKQFDEEATMRNAGQEAITGIEQNNKGSANKGI